MSALLGGLDGPTVGMAIAGGAVVGSTAGAAVARWPRGRMLRRPVTSRCRHCAERIRARDLVPILSWLVLRGRCRSCRGRIDARLPVIELIATTLTVVIIGVHGPTASGVLLALGAIALLVASATDLESRIIPNQLTALLACLGLGALVLFLAVGALEPSSAFVAIAWALGVPGALWALDALADRSGRQRPVGGGDIKLLVGVLALIGLVPGGAPSLLRTTVLIAGVIALIGIAVRRLGRRSRMPLAPAIAMAYVAVVVMPVAPMTFAPTAGIVPWG